MISYEIPKMINHFYYLSDVNRYKFHSTWTARMNYHRMSIIFVLFGIVYLLSVKVTNGQQTNSQDSTGSNHSCPVLILYPSFLYATFGKRVNFTGTVEAKLEYPIEGLWQRLQNGVLLKNINQDEKKYLDTNALAPSQLVINNVDFDDEGEYRLQVRISTGWCSSNTVRLQHVYGILDYNASCNKTRECDERKHLQCSRKTCLCYDSHYLFNQTCFPKSDLRAPIYNYNISEFSMYFKWTQPTHSDLIKNYAVSIRHNNGTSITSKSVGKQTSFTFPYNFIPGYRYYVKIASNVQIHQPREQFIENSELGIVLAPLPPGPIDRNQSNFHPEKLHLKWTVPMNNTKVDSYQITISDQHSTIITSYPSSNDLEVSKRFQPGTNYTVELYTRSYGSYSPRYTEEFQTLRTPLLTINPSGWPDIPYLSNLEIQCIIRNISDFPPTLETKWQRNKLDVNISDAMYKGSSLDLINPKLVINRIDFDRDDDVRYRCMAQNSEGWGSSLSDIRIDVKGSIKFQKSCNYSRECLYGAHLTCSNRHCLCSFNYYHKNEVCYYRDYLQTQSVGIRSTTCDISITWKHPSQHADLVTGYEVYLQEKTENSWKSSKKVYAGNNTSYTSPCTLKSGRLYGIYIRSQVLLSNPTQKITVDTSLYETILEPRKPCAIVTNLSNFSADGVHLVWEESDGFVNRYIVRIDDHEQETLDGKPTIDWDQLLLPDTLYNVTITAISYGFTTNYYHSYGRRLSLPAASFILTTKSQYTGKAFLSYGDGDYKLTGDDVTSPALRSPTTVYIGDGSEDGFNYVVIGTNGVIGLGETFNSGSIHAMDSKHVKKRQILCPFWTDLASKDNVGKVCYNTYRRGKDRASVDSAFMEKADGIVKKYFKDFKYFKATWLVKVTWENMTLYGHKEQKITFQCFLITDGENTFAVLNYIDINLKTIKNLPISIGYRYNKFYVKNSFTNQNNAFRMSLVPGNRGERGFWIYKMTDGVKSKQDEKECFLWYSYNIEKRIHHGLSHVLFDIQCPCDQRLLRFDPRYAINRFDETNRLLCYASITEGTNIECCYDMYADVNHLGPLRRSAPFAGTVLQYSPFFQRYRYMNYDMKPRNLCCSTGHCDWYYEVRSIPYCYWRSPFQPGINFGDPHITTLDGFDYTFNGYGEYTMIKINTSTTSFTLQARTELATTENGTTINATIFSAFAAKDETGSSLQIEMSRDKKGMVIFGNGIDLTNRFKKANYTFRNQNLTIYRENRTIAAIFLKSLHIIKISLGKRFLICETLINEKYKGMTTGLMGNFDGNKTNDFILPNGTMLPHNATNSEKKIFYNFGQHWSVNNESLFQYSDELSYLNYSHPEFVPMFTDEVDKGQLNEAIQKCGSNASKACIADYLATGDIALAKVSGDKEHDSKSDVATIENETPQISGNTTLYVEANKEVELKFNVSDDVKEKPVLKLLKKPDDFHLDNEANTARWIPKQSSIPEISIVAIDGQGAQSSALEYNIVLCDGCGSHGECDYETTTAISNLAKRAGCNCQTGYSGEKCNIDKDGCSQNPCPLERNCTDLSPEEETLFGRGYNCSSCPLGYNDVENKCQDIDECESDDNSCDKSKETCENSDGSYICNCVGGYRKLNQQCNDIDECIEKRSGCEQLCHNTPGSFSCSCLPGFVLNADNTTCSQTDADICKKFEKKCEYSCSEIEGVTQCICPSGYKLTDNGINCTDIDECSLATTPCDQECTNLNGSFQCTCRPGYSLKQDKTTCSKCDLPNYGVNCSQVCECGPGVDRCDSVSGCVCLSGWTGKSCDVDIDECQENPNICGTQKICVNNEGSYGCVCGEGLKLVDTTCEDIDECSDDSLNDCPPETTQCVNRFGNYSCNCKPGFQGQGSDCKDIDECHLGIHKCSQGCENKPGTYNCWCYFGFHLNEDDSITCEMVKDTCSLYPNLNCTYGCKKINENEGVCICESGYEVQSDGSCHDIDECQDSSTCDHNCTNKKGSFSCSCAVGYRLGNDGKSCTVCNPGFYGENCETQCKCGRGSKECDNIKGCVCYPGWRGETCEEDINECDSSPCTGDHEVCLNTPGSFRCNCLPGFKNSSGTCEDIDECQEPHVCHQLCTNTNGSYTCGCKAGYELINSKDCVDIDECDKARCSKCSNWPGSFMCSCSDGYRLNATTLRDCENVNECQENIHNCSLNATCTDTDGSFNCNCQIGTHGDGYSCTACPPFTYGEQCLDHCKCEKNNSDTCDAVTGSCHCKTGWTGNTCSQDVDECKEGIITCNTSLHQVCVNDQGSSHCECLYGGNNLTHCIRPQSPIHINATDVKVKAEVRFDIKARREDFLLHSEEWRIQIEETLRIFHHENVPGFSTLIVLSIRLGSLLVDYEIIGKKTQSNKNKFESGVASSMSKILKGEHKFKILNQEAPVLRVTMKDNNGSATLVITTPASPCYLLKAFYECPSGYHCDDSSNKAECVLNDFSDLAIITISVGVGVPLLIAAIVIIIVWKRYQRKVLKLKEKSDNVENLPVTLAGKIPRPKHSPSSEYDFIDSQSLNDCRYTDLGCINPNYSEDSHRERRYQADDQFPIKRPNVGPGMTREY